MYQQKSTRLAFSLQESILDLIIVLKEDILTKNIERKELTAIEFFFSRLNPQMVMRYVTEHILPFAEKIEKRDKSFFLENTTIFKGLPDDRVKYYSRQISDSSRMDDDDTEVLWNYFDGFVMFAKENKKNA